MRIIFISNRKGKSKKTGEPYNMVELAQIMDDEVNEVYVKQHFCDYGIDFSEFRLGDEVSTKFLPSEFLGGLPRLVGLTLVKATPYKIK